MTSQKVRVPRKLKKAIKRNYRHKKSKDVVVSAYKLPYNGGFSLSVDFK